MRNVSPQVDAEQVTIAEEQAEFKTVVAVPVHNEAYGYAANMKPNTTLLAYKPNAQDLEKLAKGEYIYLHFLMYGEPLTPHIISVGTEELTGWYGVQVVRPDAVLCKRRRYGPGGALQQCESPKNHEGECGPWVDFATGVPTPMTPREDLRAVARFLSLRYTDTCDPSVLLVVNAFERIRVSHEAITEEDVLRLRGAIRFAKDMSNGEANTRGLEKLADKLDRLQR